jgi:hypothetical protein
MNPRYRTGEMAEPGDRLMRQGEFGTIVCVGQNLADYGLDPNGHEDFAMIKYENLGLVCEPTNSEDIELIEKNTKEK